MTYDPRHSGFLKGGGVRRYKKKFERPTRHFPHNLNLKDASRIRQEIPDFEEGVEYTQRELILLAEKILLEDPKPPTEPPVILFADAYLRRIKHEIYTSRGTPDPSIVSGLYWRTHPNGLGWRNEEERKANGASFYKT